MTWKTYVDTAHDAIHVMPETNPPHEYLDCWCNPAIDFVTFSDATSSTLVSHRREDGYYE